MQSCSIIHRGFPQCCIDYVPKPTFVVTISWQFQRSKCPPTFEARCNVCKVNTGGGIITRAAVTLEHIRPSHKPRWAADVHFNVYLNRAILLLQSLTNDPSVSHNICQSKTYNLDSTLPPEFPLCSPGLVGAEFITIYKVWKTNDRGGTLHLKTESDSMFTHAAAPSL